MNLYPEYEYKCTRCDGNGVYFDSDDQEFYLCYKCGGTGAILTRQGALLIEFIKRHLRLTSE